MKSRLTSLENLPEAGAMTSESTRGSSRGDSTTLGWSCSGGKRIFDLCVAIPVMLVSSPAMLVAAAMVKCSSPGPVLFRQDRVGQNGLVFQVLKFRTMTHGKGNTGPGVTQQGDPRIFPAGRWLRKWKLDELPQFFNVVRGEMSLVGPRPDLPGYMASLNEGQREVLLVRPGITGAATLEFRHEEDLLAHVPAAELTKFYTSRILPKKVGIDIAYARKANLLDDVKVLLRTAGTIFS
jgi:lipopolysaccharide/colanic/teichoic acid biosynthesis glycosyltransferase